MMAATYATGKAQRKTLMFFFKVPGGSSPAYEIIGKGIEEAGISQSANVETVVDILGNTETTLDQYEKTTELDPIYVTGDSKFSQWLDEVEEKREDPRRRAGDLPSGQGVQDHWGRQICCLGAESGSRTDRLWRWDKGRKPALHATLVRSPHPRDI